jgi:hypothetical protein
LTGIEIIIRISIRILTDAISVTHIDIGTMENVWLRKMLYQRIGKIPIKLESAFRIKSINIRKIEINWTILSPMKIKLERISRLY